VQCLENVIGLSSLEGKSILDLSQVPEEHHVSSNVACYGGNGVLPFEMQMVSERISVMVKVDRIHTCKWNSHF
jgi:hypothetical protein